MCKINVATGSTQQTRDSKLVYYIFFQILIWSHLLLGMLASYFFIQQYSPGYLPLFFWKNKTMASITTGHSSCRNNGNCSAGLLLSYHDNQRNATEQSSDSGAQGILGTETAITFYEEADNKQKAFVDNFSKQFPIIESERFMIYTCSGLGLCGGWGDRLRGLYSVYLLSALQNRSYGIEMNRPCPIEKFLARCFRLENI